MESVRAALSVDVENKSQLSTAVKRLHDADFLLQDPARSFVRSGNLVKKSGRNGKMSEYRFFLFSDVLLYGNVEQDGKCRIHEELPLHLMKVIDWFPPSQKQRTRMIEIHHPRKSFSVICKSAEDRKCWVDDLRRSIHDEMDRKMKVEAARLATHLQG